MHRLRLHLFLIISIAQFCFASIDYSKTKPLNDDTLQAIMNYDMAHMIARCKEEHGYSDEDMVILERELKRYLTLSLVKDAGKGMYSKDVDNLWHFFILFTTEYAQFCDQCIGRFLHHIPELNRHNKTEEEMAEVRKDLQAFVTSYEATFNEEIHPIWLLDMCEEN